MCVFSCLFFLFVLPKFNIGWFVLETNERRDTNELKQSRFYSLITVFGMLLYIEIQKNKLSAKGVVLSAFQFKYCRLIKIFFFSACQNVWNLLSRMTAVLVSCSCTSYEFCFYSIIFKINLLNANLGAG